MGWKGRGALCGENGSISEVGKVKDLSGGKSRQKHAVFQGCQRQWFEIGILGTLSERRLVMSAHVSGCQDLVVVVLLASSGQRAGKLLNILQCTGQPLPFP